MSMIRPRPRYPLFPYTTLFRSRQSGGSHVGDHCIRGQVHDTDIAGDEVRHIGDGTGAVDGNALRVLARVQPDGDGVGRDRKSTRLNSSHITISYAVFCLKKKTT